MKKNRLIEVNLVVNCDLDVLHSIEYGDGSLLVEVDGKMVKLDVQMFQVTSTEDL